MAALPRSGGEKRVSLARDFSRHPGPRFIRQGRFSGELFRRMLVELLSQHDTLTVDLDGTSGLGSSFLDEAFGGLIRKEGFTNDEVRRRVKVRSDQDATYLLDVQDILGSAQPSH